MDGLINEKGLSTICPVCFNKVRLFKTSVGGIDYYRAGTIFENKELNILVLVHKKHKRQYLLSKKQKQRAIINA